LNQYKSKEYKKTVFVSDLPKVAKLLSQLMLDDDVGRSGASSASEGVDKAG